MHHHRRGLRRALRDDELAAAIEEDYRTAPLDPKRRAMLEFVDKLTRSPAAMERRYVENLRAAGFADRDILDVVEVAAYYAYANRVADGLGIAVENPERS